MARSLVPDPSNSLTFTGIEIRFPPSDILAFIPWACRVYEVEASVFIFKEFHTGDVSGSARSNNTKEDLTRPQSVGGHMTKQDITITMQSFGGRMTADKADASEQINILAIFQGPKIVHLKIDSPKMKIERKFFKVLEMSLKFNKSVNAITIKRGINEGGIHELQNLLLISNISEIILDGTYLQNAIYYVLLDKPTQLQHLSLARCHIEDTGVQPIAERLAYLHPASRGLAILDLSSNRITDVGAKYLANALRTNTHLTYLNVMNNFITDNGAKLILDTLKPFPLTEDELKTRDVQLKKYILKLMSLMSVNDRKQSRNTLLTINKAKRRPRYMLASFKFESSYKMALNVIGCFQGLYPTGLFSRNGTVFFTGNNTLAYLNLSYNHVSLATLKVILEVLRAQNTNTTKVATGLVMVRVDGNAFPDDCKLLKDIDDELDLRLANFGPRRRSRQQPTSRPKIRSA